jgi:hypothetical protein
MSPGVPTPQLLDYINQPDTKLRAENQTHEKIQAEREDAAAELARAAVNPPKGWRPDEGVSFVEAVDYRPTRVKMTLSSPSAGVNFKTREGDRLVLMHDETVEVPRWFAHVLSKAGQCIAVDADVLLVPSAARGLAGLSARFRQ